MKNKQKNTADTLNFGPSTNLTLQQKPQNQSRAKTRNKNNASVKENAGVKPQGQTSGGSFPRKKDKRLKNTEKPPISDVKTAFTQITAPQEKQTKQRGVKTSPYAKPRGKLKVMFLGGVGEIGKNMTVFEYGSSIVIVDCGMSFPSSDMPGVDVVIPDMTYLVENRSKIKAVLLTHGHEDHIGAVPFLAQKLGIKADVYGTKLTLALVENKLLEHNCLDKVCLVPVSDKSVVTLGDFTAEFIHVSHSVAGSVAICLRSPVGTVLHTGDFKIDYTPLGNEIMNLNRIAEIGKQGVLLLMSESTNVEKPGYTMSESVVRDTINKVFQEAKGRRIIIATFASNVDRLGMIIELAKLYRRKIAISGRSMIKYIETAARVGQLTIDRGMLVDIDKIGSVEDGKLVILSTGSQGEPMSALTRMASGEFNKVHIGANDTIVISATPIPGNERDIYSVINKLYRLGAVVVYSALEAVHVSGHACQEELKLIYTLVKPKYFIPVHGEYRHLKQHATMVEKLHHKRSNIIIPEIGDCVELDASVFKVIGQVNAGSVMVDGLGIGDVGNMVIRDRLNLAEEGILVCVMGVSRATGKLVTDIEVVSRGCFFAGDTTASNPADDVKQVIKDEVIKTLQTSHSVAALKSAVQRAGKHYFRSTLKRNPVVLPVILEV